MCVEVHFGYEGVGIHADHSNGDAFRYNTWVSTPDQWSGSHQHSHCTHIDYNVNVKHVIR